MVMINYCPSCGEELTDGSFICPKCGLDIEELFGKGYLLVSNGDENSIELCEGSIDDEEVIVLEDPLNDGDIMNNEKINVNPGDEIVIVVPEGTDEDEIVIDLDELGIDVENLDEDVNIVIQVEGEDFDDDDGILDDDDEVLEANEWYFDDDPYDIVYYEFVNDED